MNFYKNQELLRKAREVKTIADMPKFVTLLHQAHLPVTEEDSEDVLRSLEGCLDRGELLQRLTTLGGTKTMNGALLVLPQFSQGHNILLWLFFHAGMMVKMLVFKHGCTSGISLWVRHAENHEYSKRIVNCLPVMHIMATIIRKCIQLQSGLAKLDEEFASTEDIRAKIVALCKHDLSEVSSSSRSVLTSEAKLRSIVVLQSSKVSKTASSSCSCNFYNFFNRQFIPRWMTPQMSLACSSTLVHSPCVFCTTCSTKSCRD